MDKDLQNLRTLEIFTRVYKIKRDSAKHITEKLEEEVPFDNEIPYFRDRFRAMDDQFQILDIEARALAVEYLKENNMEFSMISEEDPTREDYIADFRNELLS